MKPTNDTIARALLDALLEDLPAELVTRAEVCFTMRATLAAVNSRRGLRRWAALVGGSGER
jgi:hypothetical protein